jgi:hypothetical protein
MSGPAGILLAAIDLSAGISDLDLGRPYRMRLSLPGRNLLRGKIKSYNYEIGSLAEKEVIQ